MTMETRETPPVRRFNVNRWANLRLALACAAAVGAFWLPVLDSPKHQWAGTIFFGIGVPLGLLTLVPGSTYLELRPEGFLARSYFIPWRVRWTDVEAFHVGHLSAPRSIGFVYKEDASIPRAPRWARRLVRAITGTEAALAFDYGVDSRELVGLMEGYRRAAESGASAEAT